MKRTKISGVFRVPRLSDVRYILFDILDKWEDSDPVRNHCQRVPLNQALPTMQKNGRPIPVPQNE